MAEVVTKVITWDDYVRGEPAELEHYEIEDGVVIELPAPTLHHQRIVCRLLRFLEDFFGQSTIWVKFLPLHLMLLCSATPLEQGIQICSLCSERKSIKWKHHQSVLSLLPI